MSRKRANKLDGHDVIAQIGDRLGGSSLDAVAQVLTSFVEGTKHEWGTPTGQLVLSHAKSVNSKLPSEEQQTERFIHDSLMIKSLAKELSEVAAVSDLIVPNYGDEWHLDRLPIFPGPDKHTSQCVDLISFPGENSLDDIDLSDYAWLVHELIHSVIYQNQNLIDEIIRTRMGGPLRDLGLSPAANKGVARAKSQSTTKRILEYWTLTADHANWAHEMIIDVLCVQIVGAAYIRAFLEETDHQNPFERIQSHPPLFTRCTAINHAAESLGWISEMEALKTRLSEWELNFEGKDNVFLTASQGPLLHAGIDAALDVGRVFSFPKCSQADWNQLTDSVLRNEIPEPAHHLLLAASIASSELSSNEYDDWTKRAIDRTMGN